MTRHRKQFDDLDTARVYAADVERMAEETLLFTAKQKKQKSLFMHGFNMKLPDPDIPEIIDAGKYHWLKQISEPHKSDVYIVEYGTWGLSHAERISVPRADIIAAKEKALGYLEERYQELAPNASQGMRKA